MTDFEKLVLSIMRDAEKDGEPVTREEAEEMAKMEQGAKENTRYERNIDKPVKKTAPKKAVSAEKQQLFNAILGFLTENFDNLAVLRENKLIEVEIGGKIFKIDVIEQRKAK